MKEKKGVTTIYMKDGKKYYQYLTTEEAMDRVIGDNPALLIKDRDFYDSCGNAVDGKDLENERVRVIEVKYNDGPLNLEASYFPD